MLLRRRLRRGRLPELAAALLGCLSPLCAIAFLYRYSGGGHAVTSTARRVARNATLPAAAAAAALNASAAAERLRAIRARHVSDLWAELADLASRPDPPDWLSELTRHLAAAGPGCPADGGAVSGNGASSSTQLPTVLPGCAWSPHSITCAGGQRGRDWRSGQALAVVVPFRDRWPQLRSLLAVLHPVLQRQSAGCYRVFVVEQYGCGGAFNKGRLNNAGFLEALRMFNFTCVIFQDADIVPESDAVSYKCGFYRPLHLAVALDIRGYRLPYAALVGGVIAFTPEQYFRVNGYSNLYWGWGLEDDDMELRMKVGTRLQYDRPPAALGRFRALPHPAQRIYRLQADRRLPLLKTAHTRFAKEGLNTVHYKLLAVRLEPLYTHLLVDVGEQPADFELAGFE